MAGFFSVRIAPGIRLSASRRGLRAHIGPRSARLHVGGGRAGVSTGAGPFTYYESLSGGRGGGGGSPRRPPAAKAQRAQAIAADLEALTSLHRHVFPPAQKAPAPRPPVPKVADVVDVARAQARQGIHWWRRSDRRKADAAGRAEGRRRHAAMVAAADEEQAEAQREIDQRWQDLLANDPDTVIAVLTARFDDNDAPAAVVNVEGSEVQLAVLVPGRDVVPQRLPSTTAAGNLSLRKMSATLREEFYREGVAGHVVATAKEAFAGAPAVTDVAVVAVRDEGDDIYGKDRVRPVVAVRFTRDSLAGVQWADAGAWDVVSQAGTDLAVHLAGRTHSLEPLDLTGEPDLQQMATAIDWDDFADADDHDIDPDEP